MIRAGINYYRSNRSDEDFGLDRSLTHCREGPLYSAGYPPGHPDYSVQGGRRFPKKKARNALPEAMSTFLRSTPAGISTGSSSAIKPGTSTILTTRIAR